MNLQKMFRSITSTQAARGKCTVGYYSGGYTYLSTVLTFFDVLFPLRFT